jgi:hypothetical protein
MTLLKRLTLSMALLACCSAATAQGVTPFCDMLYWHASEQASTVWSNSVTSSSFAVENVPFDWSPGFRLGFGHQADEQSWDVKLYWTYFRTSRDVEVASGTSLVIPEFFSGFVAGDTYFYLQGWLDWNLTYNTIDLEAGRKFAVGQSAWLRPSLGIKTAVIQQKARLDLADQWLGLSAEEDVTHDFWGIGPSFGISGAWVMPRCRSLSLVGSFSGDLLFGEWNVNDAYTRTDQQIPLGVYGALTTSMKNSSLGTPVLRYFLGLEWEREGCVTITGRVGYELQWWANQQRMTTFQQLPMHGDLTLQGLTCGISVGF